MREKNQLHWKTVYLNFMKLLRVLALESNKRFSDKSKFHYNITFRLHTVLTHIFWTVYCNSSNNKLATSLAKRSKTFYVEFICMSHDVKSIDENFEDTISDGFQFAIKNTIGEFKCTSKKKPAIFDMIDNSCNNVSKLLYICHENDVSINEDIFVIIIENMFLEETHQEELDILIYKVREHNLTSQSISAIILTMSYIIEKNKLKYGNNRSDIESKIDMIIRNISNCSHEIKDIIAFSKNFAEDY